LAFERVEVLNPAATDLLRVCALLASEAIPEEIFREGALHLGLLLASGGVSWDQAIGVLHDYSLVLRSAEAQSLTIHRLVQAVLQDTMDEQTLNRWGECTVLAVNTVFPEDDFTETRRCQRYLPHALACADTIKRWNILSPEAARLLTL